MAREEVVQMFSDPFLKETLALLSKQTDVYLFLICVNVKIRGCTKTLKRQLVKCLYGGKPFKAHSPQFNSSQSVITSHSAIIM